MKCKYNKYHSLKGYYDEANRAVERTCRKIEQDPQAMSALKTGWQCEGLAYRWC